MKKTIKREYYTFSYDNIIQNIDIPNAKEIAKLSDETKKMDEIGRELLKETYERLQFAVENGKDDDEIFFHTKEIGLSKFAVGQVIRAWREYMKDRGYKTHASLEYEGCWSLCFSWKIKE